MPKILIVDSDKLTRKLVTDALRKHGFSDIIEATNGYETIKEYKHKNPDLVILDLNIPGEPEFTTLTNLIKFDSEASIIACSSNPDPSQIHEALVLGADWFLVKPFTEKILISNIKNILSKKNKKQD